MALAIGLQERWQTTMSGLGQSPGRERHGKGVVKASGMDQEDEQP